MQSEQVHASEDESVQQSVSRAQTHTNLPSRVRMTNNPALELFVGGGAANFPSHLRFGTWYHPDICHYLLQLVENQAQCLRVIFDDAGYGNNTQTFKDQLQTLIVLANRLNKPALFISKEPGANNHFICGLVKANSLVLINPLEITVHTDVYRTLAELQKARTIEHVWLSSTKMQQIEYEGNLVSCGPISLEVALHILKNFTLANLNDFWASLKTNEVIVYEQTQLNYFGISIQNTLLPESLQKLVNATGEMAYQLEVEAIRQRHHDLLATLPAYYAQQSKVTVEAYLAQCKEASPAQVVYNALLTRHRTADNIHELPEYLLLEKALSMPQNPIKFGIVEQQNSETISPLQERLTQFNKYSSEDKGLSNSKSSHGFITESSITSAQEAYDAYTRKIEEKFKGINFDRLAELIEITRSQVEAAKGRDLILLIGRTGAGKSTTLNYLMGSRLEPRKSGTKRYLVVAEGERIYAKIGDGKDSETLHPQVIPMAGSPDKLAYCDCPGFADNRTREEKLCSTIGLPMTISYARAIQGIIIVIDCQDLNATRGEGFIELLKTLRQLLNFKVLLSENSHHNALGNFIFVFTKVENDDELEDIIVTLKEFQKDINTRIDILKNELQEVYKKISASLKNLGVSINSNPDQGQIYSLYVELITKFQSEELPNEIKILSERLEMIIEELTSLEEQLGIVNAMLANVNNLFIVQKDGRSDDKEKIIHRINQLHDITSIPKDLLNPEEAEYQKRNEAWDLLDKIFVKIAREGKQLLDELNNYPNEIVLLKKYKKLINEQRIEQEELLQKLKRPDLRGKDLVDLKGKLYEKNKIVTDFLDKAMEERRIIINQLKEALLRLDTSEPTRYKHRNLEPVIFKGEEYGYKHFGIQLGAFSGLSIFSVFGYSLAVASIATLVYAKLGIDLKEKIPENILGPIIGLPGGLMALKNINIVCNIFNIIHHFQYHDLPFIDVQSKCLPLNQELSDSEKKHLDRKSNNFGSFDTAHQANRPEEGIFEITYQGDRTKFTGEISVWIELFVEKKIHPDIRPRIEIINKQLKLLEVFTSSYLKDDVIQSTEMLNNEKKLIDEITDKETLRHKLYEIIHHSLSNYKDRIKVLNQCILGYQTSVQDCYQQLVRKRTQYVMLKQVVDVIGNQNQFVNAFLWDYNSYLGRQARVSYITTVWGRKSTPQQQPDYVPFKEVTGGTSISAFFKLADKPNSSGWIGKLGYRSLSPSEAPNVPEEGSLTRRGSSLQMLLEKIAADLYTYLSAGQYIVPKTRVAELPMINKITQKHALTASLFAAINKDRPQEIKECIYVMSKYVDGFKDLAELKNCILDGKEVDFMQCLEQKRLPELARIEDKVVPIKGLMEILAVARLLADTDVLGGGAKNAGFLIERNAYGIPIAVRVVKIDPGYTFNFDGPENLVHKSYNPHIGDNLLKYDQRNIQYGNCSECVLLWGNLTNLQQKQFITTLKYGLAILHNDELVNKFISRKEFEKTPKQRDLPKASEYLKGLKSNLNQQEAIYEKELDKLGPLVIQDPIPMISANHMR